MSMSFGVTSVTTRARGTMVIMRGSCKTSLPGSVSVGIACKAGCTTCLSICAKQASQPGCYCQHRRVPFQLAPPIAPFFQTSGLTTTSPGPLSNPSAAPQHIQVVFKLATPSATHQGISCYLEDATGPHARSIQPVIPNARCKQEISPQIWSGRLRCVAKCKRMHPNQVKQTLKVKENQANKATCQPPPSQ